MTLKALILSKTDYRVKLYRLGGYAGDYRGIQNSESVWLIIRYRSYSRLFCR